MNTPTPDLLDLAAGHTKVTWRRSSRARRVSLRIDPSAGAVIVTLPTRASRDAGLALLSDNATWVADRLAALPDATPIADGGIIPLHGRPHTIRHDARARGGAWIADGIIHVAGRPEFLGRRVRDLLRAEARRVLTDLSRAKAASIGATVRRVTVKDTRSRWGSCASDGAIAFSWRLVMAPPFVQDYVVAHEIAHLRHMNHGVAFWALVRRLTPHTDAAVTWLNREGAGLLRVG